MRCVYFQLTYRGPRCILASPEEWRALLGNGKRPPCKGGSGSDCPFRKRAGV